jgi:hypothetical protein
LVLEPLDQELESPLGM